MIRALGVLLVLPALTPAETRVHVWTKHEITLTAANQYRNPYTEVEVWVDLTGPGFARRVYGFWDGGQTFRVRVLATAPGRWSWSSGANRNDPGLRGRRGSFTATAWSEPEKEANACRRGMLRPTSNGHAFEYADGTPCFLLADTWWATPTFRFRWYDDDNPRPIGPEAGFKDYVRLRRRQGYNGIALLAAFPAWNNDGKPDTIRLDDAGHTVVRAAWRKPGAKTAKEMHNEGGRPFLFPGKVPGYEDVFPDVERINPAYFQHLDKKIDYLNENGFTPFIEVARRDLSQAWKKFYPWPDSYARYIQYVFSRYQANHCLFSPIHFDTHAQSIPSREYNLPANLVIDRYGPPPFGTLVSTNAGPSTLLNFGGPEEAKWLTFHQIGNWREHEHYWYLTEIFRSMPPRPALNGEPYYAGYYNLNEQYKLGAEGGSATDDLYCRSGMYGSFLSGGFAGHIYGAEGIWGADIEPEARVRMWEAFGWNSGAQMRHLRTFALSGGVRYRDLIPEPEIVTPNKSGPARGYRGWAFAARTREKDFVLAYFEEDCPRAVVRALRLNASYRARWFDPRTGEWRAAGSGVLTADAVGRIPLPEFPAAGDWGLSLVLQQ